MSSTVTVSAAPQLNTISLDPNTLKNSDLNDANNFQSLLNSRQETAAQDKTNLATRTAAQGNANTKSKDHTNRKTTDTSNTGAAYVATGLNQPIKEKHHNSDVTVDSTIPADGINGGTPPGFTPLPGTDAANTAPAASDSSGALPADAMLASLASQLTILDQLLTSGQLDLSNLSAQDSTQTETIDITQTQTQTTTLTSYSLFSDIASILQSLQQLVQGADTNASGTTQTSAGASSTQDFFAQAESLLQNLEQDITQLSQFLSQQKDVASVLTAMSAPQTSITQTTTTQTFTQLSLSETTSNIIAASTENAPSSSDLSQLLQTGLSELKDQLQKLKTPASAAPVQMSYNVKRDFLAASAAPIAPATDNASSNADTTQVAQGNSNAAAVLSTAATAAAAVQASQAATLPAVNANDNTDQNFLPSTTFIAVTQTAQSNSKNTNSGNDNQDPNATPQITTAAIAKPEPVTADNAPSFAHSLDKATASSVTEQVAYQIKTAIGDGSSKISIQLNPNELGKLDIKLNVSANGKTEVMIVVENRNTLELLKNDASSLTRALSDAGLSADSNSLNFNLRGGQQQGQGQNNQNSGSSFAGLSNDPVIDEDTTTPATTITRNYVVNLADGLDIKI